MSYGYRFPAEFVNKTSSEVYFTWSAAQALVYNVKVQEAHYHYRFSSEGIFRRRIRSIRTC